MSKAFEAKLDSFWKIRPMKFDNEKELRL